MRAVSIEKTAMELITEADITGWFKHCGYRAYV